MSRKATDRSKIAAVSGGGDDDVETLLRAAEDELLLGLSVNSHAARGAAHSPSSYLDPDLLHRFHSLKSARAPPIQRPEENRAPKTCGEDDGDLFARFAALKGSVAVPSSSLDVGKGENGAKDGDNDDDDVDKVIRWAVDAARLDPSPESDVDDNVDSNSRSSDDDTDDDDDEEDNKWGKGLKNKK